MIMKITRFTGVMLLAGAAASVSFAGDLTNKAVSVAQNARASVDSVALAASKAVKGDQDVTPSQVLTQVLAGRSGWTSTQVSTIYKSVLMASGCSSTLAQDIETFRKAGNTAPVGSTEGVKLLAALYAAGFAPDLVEAALDSAVSTFVTPAPVYSSRQERVSRPTRFPVAPVPPTISTEN